MKAVSFIVGIVSVICLSLASCVTSRQSDQSKVPFYCIVQSATDLSVIYEINLDGKLISSNRTIPKEKGTQMIELAATAGDHILTITAPGCETWKKNITVIGGIKYGQTFVVELKKSEK